MIKRFRKTALLLLIVPIIIGLCLAIFTIFFDQAVLVRKGTIFRINESSKVVALTFDDGPSLEWTPQILDELKKAGVKATFFMLGQHVEKYPEIARRAAAEGHEIENHSYDHHVLLSYKLNDMEKEIRTAEKVINNITGQVTKYFRPPKAWITAREKKKIEEMGYKTVLWTLNSKDWVTFDDKFIIKYICHNIKPGDIILFHDSGGLWATEGGDRHETVKTISQLVKRLRDKGYRFATIDKLLNMGINNNEN